MLAQLSSNGWPHSYKTALHFSEASPSLERHYDKSIEQAFAKLTAMLHKAGARTREALWTIIGQILEHFSPEECRNYLENSGYAFE